MQNTKLHFELTIEETNLVLEALGQLPFVRVFNLIGRLQEAARGQVEPSIGPAVNGQAHTQAAHE